MDIQVARYGLTFWMKGDKTGFDTREDPDGEWVRYVEYTTALAEAQAEIARLREELLLVEAGPFRGEEVASWVRYRMIAARTVLNTPKTGE